MTAVFLSKFYGKQPNISSIFGKMISNLRQKDVIAVGEGCFAKGTGFDKEEGMRLDYEAWVVRAVAAAGRLQKGSIFLLKDLFLPTEWNPLETKQKQELGRQFKRRIMTGKIPNVAYYKKAANGSALYVKI